jgi:hypothetical protein
LPPGAPAAPPADEPLTYTLPPPPPPATARMLASRTIADAPPPPPAKVVDAPAPTPPDALIAVKDVAPSLQKVTGKRAAAPPAPV